MNSAKKLLQFDFDANEITRRALKPISIPPERLKVLEKIERDHSGIGNGPPNPETLREIYRLFIDTPPSNLLNEFNTLRRIRLLAWVLTFSEDGQHRIVDMPQLKDALQLIESRFRVSALRGVFKTLLEAWDSPNAYMLRAFVNKHLKDYDGKQKFVQKLKTNITWYCEENGAKQLATTLLHSQVKLSDVWSFLDLESSKNDYMYRYSYFGYVVKEYVSISSPRVKEVIEDIVVNFF